VLVARREDKLRNLAEELQNKYSISTRVVPVDLSQDDFLPSVQQATADLEIGLLVNNAGFATTGTFFDNDLGSELKMLHVNNRAPVILTYHFGRLMRQRGQGGIVFVASILAFAGVPTMSNYAASKAHDLVFAEGLANELQGTGISVMAICPGPTHTEFWPSGSNPFSPMQPKAVADIALRKLGKKTTVVAGWSNSITTFATRLLPRSWNAKIFGSVVGGMLKGVETPIKAQMEHERRSASKVHAN
jgi:short-subunit dehydrogenase